MNRRMFLLAAAAAGNAAGADTQVQYNNGGAFGADATFNFNDTTKILDLDGLTITGTTPIGLDMSGGTFATAVNYQAGPAFGGGGGARDIFVVDLDADSAASLAAIRLRSFSFCREMSCINRENWSVPEVCMGLIVTEAGMCSPRRFLS